MTYFAVIPKRLYAWRARASVYKTKESAEKYCQPWQFVVEVSDPDWKETKDAVEF